MTINTQRLREAAQRVIEAFGADWYAPGDWQETNDPLPYCDAHHIAAASPTVVIGLLDALDAQTAEIAGLKSQVEMLEACAAGDAALTKGQQREIALLRGLLADYDRTRDAHDIPGIWDLDNAKGLAGQPCEWCALWREVKALAQEQGGSDGGQN
ncbi:ead/Ea22-like family protein [Castellaniella sp.]|uniref:ead/Ea22-like family protein n=1 Tax=Castellaniella sp. TaxID=1955812 RepID=UPI003C75CA1B